MSIELEKLEDRLALSPAVAAPPPPPPAAAVTPAENEALLDPLRTRLGPKPEAAPLLATAPVNLPPRETAPVAAPAGLPVNFEDEEPLDPDAIPALDAPPPPTEETSDLLMSEPGDFFGGASPAPQDT